MNKLQKTAKGLDKFFSLFQKFTVAGCVFGSIMIFFMWYLYLGDPDIADFLRGSLTFGSISFELDRSVMPAENYFIWYLALGTIVGGLQLPVLYMTFGSIRGILGLMMEGTPFHEHIVYYLKRLGWLTVVNGVFDIAAGFVLQGNFLPRYDLGALFLSDKITKVTTTYAADLTFILYAVILFLLAQIFQYGLELQTLSDETL